MLRSSLRLRAASGVSLLVASSLFAGACSSDAPVSPPAVTNDVSADAGSEPQEPADAGSDTGTNPPVEEPGTACSERSLAQSDKDFFVDISEISGITKDNFVPSPPTPIPINDHSRLAMVDIDGDGFDDIVMHSLFPNAQAGVPFEHLVFRNKKDGTFEDISDSSGLRTVQSGFLAFADFDNDGDQDVFAGLDIDLAGKTSLVLLNDGQGRFTVKANSGVERIRYSANAVFADFNGDGKVDLFSGNGQSSFAAKNSLLLGNGDGTFRDTSSMALPSVPSQPTNGLVACDFDNDGDQDVLVSTYGVSVQAGWKQLWQNNGDGTFANVAEAKGFHALATGNYWNNRSGKGRTDQPSGKTVGANGFGIDCGDINNDGFNDVWMATISHADGADFNRLWSDPSQLLINGGASANFTFNNEFLDRNLEFNEGDIDAAMVDYDNDGRLDLAVTRTDKYEANFAGAEQKGWFGLFRQNADGKFSSVGLASGINDVSGVKKRMKAGQNLAWADIDHDGDADLLVGGRDQGGGRPNFLFRNELGQKNHWLALRLEGDGQAVHRDAFGTRVTIKIGDKIVMREKKSSRGTYTSIDGSALLFGLGDFAACKGSKNRATIEVRWPNGKIDTFVPSTFELDSYVKLKFGDTNLRREK
jgi:enediyne biosynthesis protein E4